jgi:hypothetical protein
MATKDVKFIIYQVLYIFVVCVIALKGANLDLIEVLAKDKVVDKEEAEITRKKLDSLLMAIMNLDTNVSKEDYDKMIQRIRDMNNIKIQNPLITQVTPNFQNNISIDQPVNTEIKRDDIVDKNINITSDIKITQYTNTTLTNPNDADMKIFADGNLLATIPSHESKSFAIANQNSITLQCGNESKTIKTLQKKAPVISVIYVGSGSSLRMLQGGAGFKVKIAYEYSDPLDITFSGNVAVKDEGNNTYTVSLKSLCGSKDDFERMYENRGDPPYRETFSVKVKDKIRNITTQGSGAFIFEQW